MSLPPLPEPSTVPAYSPRRVYTAEQMREYARAAVAAEREACARDVAKARHDLSLDPGVNGYFRSRYMPLVLRRFDALERAIRARGDA